MNYDNLSPSDFIGLKDPQIISFGSGQPDLPPPKKIYEILPKYSNFKYGTIQGILELRENLAKEYPQSTAENFVITNGASEALDLTLRVIASQNPKSKKVLLAKPYYYSYPYLIKFSGLEPIFVETENGKIIYEDFEEKVKDCCAIIINSPSNPTGMIEEIETLHKIEEVTKEKDVYIISDEVYKDLIYERENYLIKGDHVITINSFSKTYSMCGFRIGYLWSRDQEFVQKVIDIKTHTSMNTNILGQEMAIEASKIAKSEINKQMEIWLERRNLIYEGLKELGFEVNEPEGGFYIMAKSENPKKFVIDMFEKYKVITYLGEWFGAPQYIRFSYALDKEKIVEGLERIKKYLEEN